MKTKKYIFYVIIFLSIMIRICFIFGTQIIQPGMQNDLGSLSDGCFGHLGYIYYLANGGDIIHNGADRYYQFYQPPLHYLISALWLNGVLSLGKELLAAAESLQILTCIYSLLTLLFLDKMVCMLGGDKKSRGVVLGLYGFLPYSVFMSGSVNNDSISLLFMVMTIYFLFQYYEDATMRNALVTGLAFGLAIMSKMSALVLGPGMAFLLLYRMIKRKDKRSAMLLQYVCMGAIASVLAFWYPIKNYLVYGMDFMYIPKLELESEQYIGHFSFLSRLFDINLKQLSTLGVVFSQENGIQDHNIFLSLLKYSVFAESDYYLSAERICYFLFFAFAALLAVVTVAAVFSFFKADWKREYKITIALMYGVNMFSFIRFCFTHPHVCTMHVRYIMISVLLTMLCAGFYDRNCKRNQKAWNILVLLYMLIGLAFVMICLYHMNL